MLGVDRHGRAGVGLAGLDVVHPEIAAFVPLHLAAGSAVHDDLGDGFAAAHREGFLHRRLERNSLAAAHLLVSGDNQRRAHVHDALLQALGREAAEHHRVRHAQARAGLHGHHGFDRHRHVDDGAVALLVAQRGNAVGEAAHAGQQFAIGHLVDLAIVGFEEDGGLVGIAVGQVHVQAVGRDVEFAVAEPAVERGVGFVEHLRERFGPLQVVAGLPGPEPVEIVLDLRAQRVIGFHAGNGGALRRALGRRENTGFHQDGLNSVRHDFCLQSVILSFMPLFYYPSATVSPRSYGHLTQNAGQSPHGRRNSERRQCRPRAEMAGRHQTSGMHKQTTHRRRIANAAPLGRP
ncbi:hypothetical protein FQZ97_564350 [compost metagenome]